MPSEVVHTISRKHPTPTAYQMAHDRCVIVNGGAYFRPAGTWVVTDEDGRTLTFTDEEFHARYRLTGVPHRE